MKVKSIHIIGSRHSVSYWGENRIDIGCKKNTLENWEAEYEQIGQNENYSESEIAEYKMYIQLIKQIHNS